MIKIVKTAYEVEWLDDNYMVTLFQDSGVVHIQKLVKRRFRKEQWQTIFFSHVKLLGKLAKLATQEPKKVKE